MEVDKVTQGFQELVKVDPEPQNEERSQHGRDFSDSEDGGSKKLKIEEEKVAPENSRDLRLDSMDASYREDEHEKQSESDLESEIESDGEIVPFSNRNEFYQQLKDPNVNLQELLMELRIERDDKIQQHDAVITELERLDEAEDRKD